MDILFGLLEGEDFNWVPVLTDNNVFQKEEYKGLDIAVIGIGSKWQLRLMFKKKEPGMQKS